MLLLKKKQMPEYTIYNFLGLKLKIKNNKEYSLYKALHQQWRLNGFSDDLTQELYRMSNSLYNWKNLNPHIWIIYLSCLINNNSPKALDILKKYNYFYDKQFLHNCLPVAHFAHMNNITNKKIKIASHIYSELEKNRNNNELKKILEGKTIAIVGNGPSEMGKRKGAEIDNHDIVIRFNNYELKGFEQDYGSKTDIWCCNLNHDIKNRCEKYKMVVLPEEVSHKFISKVDILYKALENDAIIYNYGENELNGMNNVFFDQPTFGFRLIYGLSKILNSFMNIDFYGFNFCKDQYDTHTTHYFKSNNPEYEKLHNLLEETDFLVNLISEMKTRSL